ncbi:MAG: glycoside hydrolase family 127 protein [Eubacteriales bacterium]|nr:glycoside hydrolase family 127 protein [Eubacteriales bacterium]
MLTDTRNSSHAKVHPVDGLDVSWTGGLWKERTDTCADSTVPQLQHMFEAKDISHVVENFRICAGDAEGEFDGTVFGDGDFYKWMEAAIYSAKKTGNEALMKQVDDYVDLIGRAQQPDGYLSTKQIIGEMQKNGVSRMGDINDFEVYNFGHMFTTACLYKRMTGSDRFLKVAVRVADYLESLYEEAEKTGEVQTAVCPSHYMGLAEMYRTTGEERYLDLLKRAIRLRDSVKNGLDDNQDRIPLKEHDRIIGHAVRANYLYAGVADLCLEEDDPEYRRVLRDVWRSLVDKKLYVTGGCGALYNGVSPYGNFFKDQKTHQAYGYEYQLPNITAYNETCASLGGVFWAYRMFQLEPKAEYFDVLERMMLNTNLAAFSLDGKKFFYENMLRRETDLDYELVWPLTRSDYILSYCCPPNLARTVAESSEYAYMVSEDGVYTGMYGASRAAIRLDNGAEFTLVQETEYPFDGRMHFTAEKVQNAEGFRLMLRIPGWAVKGTLAVQGKEESLTEKDAGTYKEVWISDPASMDVVLNLEMPVRYTVAHNKVEEAAGQACVERGPLVFCVEGMDADMESLDDLYLNLQAEYAMEETEIAGRKIPTLVTKHFSMNRQGFERTALYQTLNYQGMEERAVRLIPYYAWDNREFTQMRIWFPVAWNR